MGRLLKAQCSNCGYESGLLRVEAGRRSGTTYFGAPASCYEERAVVTVNLRALHEAADDWDGMGFGTAALESGEQDASVSAVAAAGSSGSATSSTIDTVRRDLLTGEPDIGNYGSEDWSAEEEARLDYEAANPTAFSATGGEDSSARSTAESGEYWPAERGGDPGPVADDETPGEMEPAEWFPVDSPADPGPAAWVARDETTQEIPLGPWTIRDGEAESIRLQIAADQRPLATETRTSFGLVATPVEPRTTLPQMAEPGVVSDAEARSLELTGGTAPTQPADSVSAYPCPNDGTATTLYEYQPDDLRKPQRCPRCDEAALLFSVEGHWD